MPIYKFTVRSNFQDPRSSALLREARALGFDALQRIVVQDLYFIEGQLAQDDLQQLTLKLLTDPVTQSASWTELPAPLSAPELDAVILEVALRPGVTDPVAEQIVRAAHELGFDGVHRAATGQRFIIRFDKSVSTHPLSVSKSASLAAALLANNVIQHWTIGEITPSFPHEAESSGTVEIISIRELSDNELLALSKERRAALDLAELQAIQNYFIKEQRDPTDVEFETIAQTWSEHCVHKTFKAKIQIESPSPSGRGARGEGATLTFNQQGHFECRWVDLSPVSQICIWTKGLTDSIICPIAHGEGNFQTNHQSPITNLVSNDQIALTYIHADGAPANGDYPANPNGSLLDIAGICNLQGNVLGLMPHPENHIYAWQHPRHTRGETSGSGLKLFENGVKYASQI